jgi:hypothetical protein
MISLIEDECDNILREMNTTFIEFCDIDECISIAYTKMLSIVDNFYDTYYENSICSYIAYLNFKCIVAKMYCKPFVLQTVIKQKIPLRIRILLIKYSALYDFSEHERTRHENKYENIMFICVCIFDINCTDDEFDIMISPVLQIISCNNVVSGYIEFMKHVYNISNLQHLDVMQYRLLKLFNMLRHINREFESLSNSLELPNVLYPNNHAYCMYDLFVVFKNVFYGEISTHTQSVDRYNRALTTCILIIHQLNDQPYPFVCINNDKNSTEKVFISYIFKVMFVAQPIQVKLHKLCINILNGKDSADTKKHKIEMYLSLSKSYTKILSKTQLKEILDRLKTI